MNKIPEKYQTEELCMGLIRQSEQEFNYVCEVSKHENPLLCKYFYKKHKGLKASKNSEHSTVLEQGCSGSICRKTYSCLLLMAHPVLVVHSFLN